MNTIKKLLKLNLNRIILVLILLLLIDIPVRTFEAELMKSPAQLRLATQEVDSIQALIHKIKISKGYKIVFLGDSTVYGPSGGPKQTTPFYLEEYLRARYPDKDIKVFNISYKGYGISEEFFILNALRQCKIDLVIYGINMSWFNRNQVVEYTNAAKVNPDIFNKGEVDKLVRLDTSFDSLRRPVSDFLAQNWALYRNRSNIGSLILHKSLVEKLYDLKLKIYYPKWYVKQEQYWENLRLPWYTKNFSKEFSPDPSVKIGYFNLKTENPQVKFLDLIEGILAQESIPALFYATPYNRDMLNSYNRFDGEEFNLARKTLPTLIDPNVNYIDYSYEMPSAYFADSVHLLSNGHKLLAAKLAVEIEKGILK